MSQRIFIPLWCATTMQRISSAKSSGVPFNTSLTLSSWSAHSQACQLCSQECDSGGWPRKKKHTGRPLAADVTHLGREIMRMVNLIK